MSHKGGTSMDNDVINKTNNKHKSTTIPLVLGLFLPPLFLYSFIVSNIADVAIDLRIVYVISFMLIIYCFFYYIYKAIKEKTFLYIGSYLLGNFVGFLLIYQFFF